MGLFICRIARLFLLQGVKGSQPGGARDFKNMEARAGNKISPPPPPSARLQNWVDQFKRGDFSTCDAPRPERSKTVTTPEIIEQIHELILEDHRISAKSISEQLGISRERVRSIIHEDMDMRKLFAKWVPKCLNEDKKMSTVPVV